MLPIEATRKKLAEAQFFLRKLTAFREQVISNEPEAFDFYLSAFLSAARSVTFALQTEQKERYDRWFPSWRDALPPDEKELLVHFNGQRVQAVHRTGADVALGSEPLSLHEYLAAASLQGAQVEIWNGPPGNPPPQFSRPARAFNLAGTEIEVTQACTQYFGVVAKLVESFINAYADDAAT